MDFDEIDEIFASSSSQSNRNDKKSPTTSVYSNKSLLTNQRSSQQQRGDQTKRLAPVSENDILPSSKKNQSQQQQQSSSSSGNTNSNNQPTISQKPQLLFSNVFINDQKIISSPSAKNSSQTDSDHHHQQEEAIFTVFPYGRSMGSTNASLFGNLLIKHGANLKILTENIGSRNQEALLEETLSHHRLHHEHGGGLIIICDYEFDHDLDTSKISGSERSVIEKILSVYANDHDAKIFCVKKEWISQCVKRNKILPSLQSDFQSLKKKATSGGNANNNDLMQNPSDMFLTNTSSLPLRQQEQQHQNDSQDSAATSSILSNNSQQQMSQQQTSFFDRVLHERKQEILQNASSLFQSQNNYSTSNTNFTRPDQLLLTSDEREINQDDGHFDSDGDNGSRYSTSMSDRDDDEADERKPQPQQQENKDTNNHDEQQPFFGIFGATLPPPSFTLEGEETNLGGLSSSFTEHRNSQTQQQQQFTSNNGNETMMMMMTRQNSDSNSSQLSNHHNSNDDSNDFEPQPLDGGNSNNRNHHQDQGNNSSNNNTTSRNRGAIMMTDASTPFFEKKDRCANQNLVDELRRLSSVHKSAILDKDDLHRARMYSKAATQLERVKEVILSSEQVKHLPGIGTRICQKIDEIIKTGSSAKLKARLASSYVVAMEKLTKIWGVGNATAQKLYDEFSIESVEDLRNCPAAFNTLTDNQKRGLLYFEDLEQRIPRSEVELIQSVVARGLADLGFKTSIESTGEVLKSTYEVRSSSSSSGSSSSVVSSSVARNSSFDAETNKSVFTRGEVQVVTCGSFRRGALHSGDVDILICDVADQGHETVIVDMLKNHFSSLEKIRAKQLSQLQSQSQSSATYSSSASMSLSSSFSQSRTAFDPSLSSQQQQYYINNTSSSSSSSQHHHQVRPPIPKTFDLFQKLNSADGKKNPHEHHESQSWLGMAQLEQCQNPSRCPCAHKPDGSHYIRRVDIKSYKKQYFPFSLLYFTGSGFFNRAMRWYALLNNLRLSDKELIEVKRDRKRIIVSYGKSFPCETERDIFECMGLKYLEPEQRNYEEPVAVGSVSNLKTKISSSTIVKR